MTTASGELALVLGLSAAELIAEGFEDDPVGAVSVFGVGFSVWCRMLEQQVGDADVMGCH